MNLNRLLPWLLVLVLLIPVLYAYNRVELIYSISSRGILYPGKEWVLSRTADGNLINSLKDNFHNSITEYTVTEFQRGDLANFVVQPGVFQKPYVQKGDTIASISSQTERRRKTELMGELERQQRLLTVYATGERIQDINIAYQRKILALNEFETQQRISERNKVLFGRGHIPEEEYEISVNELNIKEQNYLIAQTQYEALKSGAKPEQLDLVKANIESITQQIGQLEELMDAFTITSPISGKIVKQQGANGTYEAILRVAQTDSYVLMVPVDVYHLPYIQAGQQLHFRTPGSREVFSARIAGFDNAVQMLDGRQKIFITAFTDMSTDALRFYPSMLVEVTIPSEPISVKEYLLRMVNEVYNN